MNIRTRLEWTLLLAAVGMMVTTMYFDLATDYPLGVCYALGGIIAGVVAMIGAIGLFLLPAFIGAMRSIFPSATSEQVEEDEELPEPAATWARWHGYAFGAMAFSAAGVVSVIFATAYEFLSFERAMPIAVGLAVVAVVMGLVGRWLEPPELREAMRQLKQNHH